MSEFITLDEAIQMTTNYRAKRRTIVEPSVSVDVLPICETFDKEHVESLVNNPDSVAIRAYLGLDDENNIKIILVGVDSNDEDMLSGVNVLVDKARRCPPICPPSSPLNTP